MSTHSTTMHVIARPLFWLRSARCSSRTPSSTCVRAGGEGQRSVRLSHPARAARRAATNSSDHVRAKHAYGRS
jgi:hypothetical protein